MQSPETVAGVRLAVLENRLERMERALESIDLTLRSLARVEFQNDTLASRLTLLEADMRVVKEEMPTLKLARSGSYEVAKTILVALGSALVAYVTLEIKKG